MMAELHSRGICLILRAYHANERLSSVRLTRITHDAPYCNLTSLKLPGSLLCANRRGNAVPPKQIQKLSHHLRTRFEQMSHD